MPPHGKRGQSFPQRSPPPAFVPGERTGLARVLSSSVDKPLPPPPDELSQRSSTSALAGRGSRRQKKEEKAGEQDPQASSSASNQSKPSRSTSTPRYVSLPTTGPHATELTAVRHTGPVKRRPCAEVGTIPIALEGGEGDIPIMLDLTPKELDQHLMGGRGSRRPS